MDREGGPAVGDERSVIERRLGGLIQYGADVITLHREDGVVFYAAPSLSHVLGYAVEDWLGRPLLDLIHDDDRAIALEQLAAMRRAPGVPQVAHFRLRHKGGAWRWMEATGIDLLDDATGGG